MKKRGFAAMTPERRREIASRGGVAAQKVRKFRKKQIWLPGLGPPAVVRKRESKPMSEKRIAENEIDELLESAEDGIRQMIHLARRKNSGPSHFAIVCVGDDSAMIDQMGQAGVVVSGYDRLTDLLGVIGQGEMAKQVFAPPCGHYGVFLTADEAVRFGCSECDFDIVVERAS